MKRLPITYFLGSTVLAALLAGCGGGTPPASIPSGPVSLRALRSAPSAPLRSAAARRSWMSPAAKSEGILYVSQEADPGVFAFSAKTFAPLGEILGFTQPFAMCVAETAPA